MKIITRLTFLLLALCALFGSAALVVKPSAAIFYYKVKLQMDRCTPAAGFSVRCPVNLPARIFPPEGVLLFEDGQQLPRESAPYVSTAGDGSFTTETSGEGGYWIQFAPIGNSDPFTDGKSYRAYFSVSFLTRSAGILLLGLLLAGMLSFGSFAIQQLKGVKNPLSLPKEMLLWIDRYLAQAGAVIDGIRIAADGRWQSFWTGWGALSMASGAAAYALAFMEWIFLVTGTSFMGGMNLSEKLEVILLSGLFLTCLALILVLVLLGLSLLLRLVRLGWLAFLIAELVSTALITALIVLMADNFTYVVFQFGILTAKGLLRTVYGVLVGMFFGVVYGKRLSSWKDWEQKDLFTGGLRWLSFATLGVIGISLVSALLNYEAGVRVAAVVDRIQGASIDYPNIILIGSDGVNASNMSVYGYERDTTPNLRELSSTLLIAENAFTNTGETFGSIASIFTGKPTTETGVIYPPNILQGEDAFEHLPGILKRVGYKTVEIAVPHYVDAFNMNIQDGFDEVNGQESLQKDLLVKTWRNAGYASSAYFIYKLEEKLANRLLHALRLETIANPFDVVTQPASWWDDRQKMDELLRLLDQNDQPLFVHVHLMGTHGQRFFQEAVFSLGQEQTEEWMIDFYDDSILAFDRYIGELIEKLKTNGQYDNTLLILYSDHAMKWTTNERIPLIFRFPGDQLGGRISGNTQNLDIAPTILDYLDLDIPGWMSGWSLLSANPGKDRLIFSARVIKTYQDDEEKLGYIYASLLQPPFYQFRSIGVIACDRWYELNLLTREWNSGIVPKHTTPCAEAELPSKTELVEKIAELLASHGFDVSSLLGE